MTNGYNNIIWDNTNFVNTLSNGSVLEITYSDVQSNWAGAGNISSDPLFVNPAQFDFRLATNSPALGAGYLGRSMGATFPVGAPMASSHPRIASATAGGGVVQLRFWADEGKTYTVRSADALDGSWSELATVPAQSLPKLIEISDSIPGNVRFYRVDTP